MNNSNYANYKKPLKIYCIVQVAAAAVAILAMIFLFFLPNFEINMSKVPDGTKTTLPKIENMADDFFNEDIDDLDDLSSVISKYTYVNFSCYDELYSSLNPV